MIGGAVEGTRTGLETSESALEGALQACAMLANGSHIPMDGWKALAASLGASAPDSDEWRPDPRVALVLDKGCRRTIDVVRCLARPGRARPRMVTRVSAERRSIKRDPIMMVRPDAPEGLPIADLTWNGSRGSYQGKPVPNELPELDESTVDTLNETDPIALMGDARTVTVYMLGPVFEEPRLRSALALADCLAGMPTLGRYR